MILVVSVIGFLVLPAAPAINVTQINFESADNVCGLNGVAWDGFPANTSQVAWLAFPVGGNATSGGGSAACQISTVSSATPGFTISSANVPLAIPVNTNETLNVNVTCPSSSFSGILTLTLT